MPCLAEGSMESTRTVSVKKTTHHQKNKPSFLNQVFCLFYLEPSHIYNVNMVPSGREKVAP